MNSMLSIYDAHHDVTFNFPYDEHIATGIRAVLKEAGYSDLKIANMPIADRWRLSTYYINVKTLKSAQQAVKDNPEDVDALLKLACTLGGLERENEAIAYYNQCLDIDPKNNVALDGVIPLLWYLGQFEEALTVIERALLFLPDNARLLVNRGSTLEKLGRMREAEVTFKRVYELDPDLASEHDTDSSGESLPSYCWMIQTFDALLFQNGTKGKVYD